MIVSPELLMSFCFLRLYLFYFFLPALLPAQSLEDLHFGTDSTFEAVTWNIEWFPKNGQKTVNYVSQVIEAIDVDLIAIQEVSDTTQFNDMVDRLQYCEGYLKSSWFAGLAYIYNTRTVIVKDVYEIYTKSQYWNAFPRSPMVIDLECLGENFIVINNHFKCCGDGVLEKDNLKDEEARRYQAMNLLKSYVDTQMPDKSVIILGDLNDNLTDDFEHNVFERVLFDTRNYKFADMRIAEGHKSEWSLPGWPSHIDHLLITNELFDMFRNKGSGVETIKVDQHLVGGFRTYDKNISNHRPVGIKLNPVINSSVFAAPQESAKKLAVYPNPFNNETLLVFESLNTFSTIEIFNIQGKNILSKDLSKGQSTWRWDATGYPSGTYIIRLVSGPRLLGMQKVTLIQ